MGTDPPAIAGFGGAALSAGLSDVMAGSVVGAVSMDSCLISDIRARQVRLDPRQKSCRETLKKYGSGEEKKAYAKTARLRNGKEKKGEDNVFKQTSASRVTL
jgi:hypothetical protein